MNIYQEVYDAVHKYIHEWYELQHEFDATVPEDAFVSKWTYVQEQMQLHETPEVWKIAQQKYPILQQQVQNNESEVRS